MTRRMPILAAICRQHMHLSWRSGQTVLAVSFLFIAITLLPFGLGPELKLLRALAPGLLWVVLAISLLTSLERLFQADYEDGSLDRLLLVPLAFEAVVLAKLLGHYLALVLPLIASVPLAGLLLNIEAARLPALVAAMLCGSPALVLAGGIGAALAVSVRRGGLLTVLIAMPFYVPVLIFGAAAARVSLETGLETGVAIGPYLGILAALSAASLLLAPFAIAAALRSALR
ncbi:MAG: heme exporter protein CcmB [Alphaproteobacteria bacterium]|nr:heme exporter protein CcmB [Alphaproteobacteria bacterium]